MNRPSPDVTFLDSRTDSEFLSLFPNRPLETLLFGGLTFQERWSVPTPLQEEGAKSSERDLAVVSARLSVPSPGLVRKIGETTTETAWMDGNLVLAVSIDPDRLRGISNGTTLDELAGGLSERESLGGGVIVSPWEMVSRNGRQIEEDLAIVEGARNYDAVPCVSPPSAREALRFRSVEQEGEGALRIGADTHIEPFVFLDTSDGPIWIGAHVTIEAGSILRGPVWVRDRAIVRGGAKVVEGSTIGEGSRIGGELEATIFGAFSNKQHEGFLGHALIGEWVNLGASTNNSDLKNNYGPVRVDLGQGPIDTGEQKVGCMLGDHVKSAIGTRFSTGAAVGPCANLFGPSGLVSGWIPPFTWGESGGLYQFERAVDTIRQVRSRRLSILERSGRATDLGEKEVGLLREIWEERRG